MEVLLSLSHPQVLIGIFFTIVGDQTPGSWKCLWEEHPGGKARSGTRHYSFHQAERPRIFPQCPVA